MNPVEAINQSTDKSPDSYERCTLSVMLWLGIGLGIHVASASVEEEAISGWLDSVVQLTTGPALCAGVLLEQEGLVATAYHCVASGRRPKVETQGGEVQIGRVVAADPKNDLALVEVPPFESWNGVALRVGDPQVGEKVWALGHPFGFNADMVPALEGLLRFSVSSGIVSAVGPRLVQVDAPLNPGNSGGPILDAEGRIIGIASRKLRGEGLSFIVPASMLAELQVSEKAPRILGGQYGLVLAAIMPSDILQISSVELGMRVALRDTLVFTGLAAWPIGARWEALSRGEVSWVSWESTAALRARAGRGRWSTSVDLGVVALGIGTRKATLEGERLVEAGGEPEIEFGGLVELQLGGAGYGLRLIPRDSGGLSTYLVISTVLGGVAGSF